MSLIAERLRSRREDAGLTRKELSERSGVHQATITDIEEGRNKNPGYDKVVLLARALRLRPDVLYPVPDPVSQSDEAVAR